MVPSKTRRQHMFMEAVSHNPAFAKKVGVPQSVGREFVQADKGRKFAEGGQMKESKAMVGKELAFMKKKGAPKSMIKHEKAEYGMKKGGKVSGPYRKAADGIAVKGKTKGKEVKMMKGGYCG